MRRYLIDTNVLVDAMVRQRPGHDVAMRVLARNKLDRSVVLSAFLPSLKDAYYIARRHYGDERAARKGVSLLFGMLDGVGLDARIVESALRSDEPDFEDGLVRAAAEISGCDGIISRDAAAFANSRCERIDPIDFIAMRS